MKFVLAVPVLLGLVLAQEPTVTFSGEQKIDSCDVSLQGEGAYRTLVTKTQPLCKLSVQAPAGSVILVTVKNKGKNCFKEPSKIFVVDGGKNGQLQCDGRNEEWLTSSTSSIDVVYSPRQPHLISFKFAKKLPCSASIGFNELDQSFLLEGRRGETCLVLVPGRTRVVLERLQLVEEECRSHVQMRTGPHIDELKFSSRLFCADDNNLRNEKTVITCNKGVVVFRSASTSPESVLFHIEIVEDDTALAIGHYKCFE